MKTNAQIISLVDGTLRRDLESLERKQHLLECKHRDKVKTAQDLVDGQLNDTYNNLGNQPFFQDKTHARSFLSQCSSRPGNPSSILNVPLEDYHEWALVTVEVLRLKLTRQELLDRIRSEYATTQRMEGKR
jgi:hypothetical protein